MPDNSSNSSNSSNQQPSEPLSAGSQAPDFTLPSTPDQNLRLSDLRGRPVILAFYPADWSPVCGDQMALYNEMLKEFGEYDAQLLGISVDGAWCHAAFAQARKLHFPLLADFEPKGAVAKTYGAYHYDGGTAQRALFVIDANGTIQWSYVSPMGVNPGADGILTALEKMGAPKARKAPNLQHEHQNTHQDTHQQPRPEGTEAQQDMQQEVAP